MPDAPTASTVPPVMLSSPSLSMGELSLRDEEKTRTSPPVMFRLPLESRPSPCATSTSSVPPATVRSDAASPPEALIPSSSA